MPSAIEEMSKSVVQDAPVTPPADIAPNPAPAAPAPSPEPSKPAPAPEPAPAPAKPATPKEEAFKRASDRIAKILEPAKPKVDKAKLAELSDEEAEKIIKANPGSWKVYEAKRNKWNEERTGFATKTAELEKKIAELLAKPNPTAADDTKLKALEERLAARETEYKSVKQQLVERDYTQSDEYKEKFIKPWQRAHDEAYSFVNGLQVIDPDTGDPVRQATPADFDKIKATPLQQRRAAAKAMFGEDSAGDVVEYAKEIDRLVKGSSEAIKDHAQNWEKTAAEKEAAAQRDREGFTKLEQDERADLEQKFPDYFSVEAHKDNPEHQKALADAYQTYDTLLSTFDKQTPQQQASNKVLVRAWFAAFPLMHKQNAALKSQVESLTAELTKLRGTDPGAAAPKAGAVAPVEELGGIKDAAAKFRG